MSELTDNGFKLLENGYRICPIWPETKYPKNLKNWANCPQTKEAIAEWAAAGYTGVGVICGQVVAADVDVPTVKIGQGVLNIIKKYIGNGVVLIRTGAAPKYLVVFRTEKTFTKKCTPVFWGKHNTKHQVEFLADGQQFCAFADYPGTGKPYTWNVLSILDYKVNELPVLTEQQADEMLMAITQLFRRAGLREEIKPATTLSLVPEMRADQMLDNYTAPLDLTPERIEETLAAIPIGRIDDYSNWVTGGMALYHQFKGDPVGLGYWEQLSMRSSEYKEGDCSDKWDGFSREPHQRQTSFKTLLQWAKEAPELLVPSDHLMMRLSDFMHLNFPKKPMFIEPCFGPGTLTMLYGPPGVGKSYLAFDLLRALHTGTPWLGWDINLDITPRSLIIDGEMPADLLQQRMTDVFHDMTMPHDCYMMSKQHFLDNTPEATFNLANESTRDYIMKQVVEKGINVLIIDNKASLVRGVGENVIEENDAIIDWLVRLRSMGVLVILVHHSGKSGQQRGTTGYEDPMDNILKITKNAAGGVGRVLTWDKDRRGRPNNCDDVIELNMSPIGELPVTFTVVDNSAYPEINRLLDDVKGFPRDSSAKRATRLELSTSTVDRRLAEAITNKYLKREKLSTRSIEYTLTTTGSAYMVEGNDFGPIE